MARFDRCDLDSFSKSFKHIDVRNFDSSCILCIESIIFHLLKCLFDGRCDNLLPLSSDCTLLLFFVSIDFPSLFASSFSLSFVSFAHPLALPLSRVLPVLPMFFFCIPPTCLRHFPISLLTFYQPPVYTTTNAPFVLRLLNVSNVKHRVQIDKPLKIVINHVQIAIDTNPKRMFQALRTCMQYNCTRLKSIRCMPIINTFAQNYTHNASNRKNCAMCVLECIFI